MNVSAFYEAGHFVSIMTGTPKAKNSGEPGEKVFDLKIVAEIAIVFAVVLIVKEIADNMAITGAGSIAMWCGIIVATLLMKRRGAGWCGSSRDHFW